MAATAVIAFVGILQWGVLGDQIEDLEQTRISDQRAWIAPRDAEIVGPVERGQTLAFEIIYENTGKQPALDVVDNTRIDRIPVPLDDRGTAYWERMLLPFNDTCPNAISLAKRGALVAQRLVAKSTADFRTPSRITRGSPTISCKEGKQLLLRDALLIGRRMRSRRALIVYIYTLPRTCILTIGNSDFVRAATTPNNRS